MAYTSPTTRSTGNTITAAIWNADMVDNIKWVAGDTGGKPHCRVYNSASIAIVTATLTTLTFDSESWDNGGCHSTASNTSRITVPSGASGYWDIGANIEFGASATGTRIVSFTLNGGANPIAKVESPVNSGSSDTSVNLNTTWPLAVGDYVECLVYQNSGGNLNVVRAAESSPAFWAKWVSL